VDIPHKRRKCFEITFEITKEGAKDAAGLSLSERQILQKTLLKSSPTWLQKFFVSRHPIRIGIFPRESAGADHRG
jgi:hypothetical protein